MSEEKETGGTPEERVIRLLQERGYRIATVESLTGGMVSASLVNVAGASQVFMQGLVTYSNEAKHRLAGVPRELLDTYGAVSEEVACAMARGGAAGCEVCVSTTGIAGPTGGTREKPVGLVYIGCCVRGRVFCRECHFSGDRAQVREQTVRTALEWILECVNRTQEMEEKSYV